MFLSDDLNIDIHTYLTISILFSISTSILFLIKDGLRKPYRALVNLVVGVISAPLSWPVTLFFLLSTKNTK